MERDSRSADRGAADASRPSPRSARERFRRRATAALEGGLIRYSRRRRLHEEARKLGLSPFEAALMIADVQYGATSAAGTSSSENAPNRRRRPWQRLAMIWSAVLLLVSAIWIVLRSRG
jgi:hypothetical protein